MSDNSYRALLLAAAPLGDEWGEMPRIPLAVMPCLGGVDLTARTAFREEA
ncbi:MAG: hypothetical protein ACLPZM_04455 [Thermoplasmata archaeon]